MVKAWFRCVICGQMIPLGEARRHTQAHYTGSKLVEHAPSLEGKSHSEALKFIAEDPWLIEAGMRLVFRELPIFKGRVDLVTRDKDGRICLIEFVHRSHKPKAYWVKKLGAYRGHLRRMAQALFDRKDFSARCLLVKPNLEVEEL